MQSALQIQVVIELQRGQVETVLIGSLNQDPHPASGIEHVPADIGRIDHDVNSRWPIDPQVTDSWQQLAEGAEGIPPNEDLVQRGRAAGHRGGRMEHEKTQRKQDRTEQHLVADHIRESQDNEDDTYQKQCVCFTVTPMLNVIYSLT